MASRGQSIILTYTAWDTAAQAPKTGDVANHTLFWIKDGTSATPTNAPADAGATGTGACKVTLTIAECTANTGMLCGTSSTVGVILIPVSVTFEANVTLADGAITDAKFTMPTEATGAPTTFLAIVLWIAGMLGLRKVVKNSNTLTVGQYMPDGTTVKTVSTYTSTGGIDTLNKAS